MTQQITLSLSGAFNAITSFLQILDEMCEQTPAAFARKNIRLEGSVCTVQLRGVRNSLELLQQVTKHLQTLNAIHAAPIQLTRFEALQGGKS